MQLSTRRVAAIGGGHGLGAFITTLLKHRLVGVLTTTLAGVPRAYCVSPTTVLPGAIYVIVYPS